MKRLRTPEQKERHAQEARAWYHKNRIRVLAGQKKYRESNREKCNEFKKEHYEDRRRKLDLLKLDRCCYDCGGVFPPESMQWDHIPGKGKKFNVCEGPKKELSEVIDEIAKCQLVCANCHAVRTVSRRRKPQDWSLE